MRKSTSFSQRPVNIFNPTDQITCLYSFLNDQCFMIQSILLNIYLVNISFSLGNMSECRRKEKKKGSSPSSMKKSFNRTVPDWPVFLYFHHLVRKPTVSYRFSHAEVTWAWVVNNGEVHVSILTGVWSNNILDTSQKYSDETKIPVSPSDLTPIKFRLLRFPQTSMPLSSEWVNIKLDVHTVFSQSTLP